MIREANGSSLVACLRHEHNEWEMTYCWCSKLHGDGRTGSREPDNWNSKELHGVSVGLVWLTRNGQKRCVVYHQNRKHCKSVSQTSWLDARLACHTANAKSLNEYAANADGSSKNPQVLISFGSWNSSDTWEYGTGREKFNERWLSRMQKPTF